MAIDLLASCVVIAVAIAVPVVHAEPAAANFLTIDAAVSAVRESNPGLAGIRARAEALAAVPSQVGALPDPKIGFSSLNLPTNSFALDQEPMTQLQIGLRQTFPFPGKLKLRERIASLNAEAAFLNVDELTLDLVAAVKSVWWQIAYLREADKIVEQNRQLMREFVEIASTKYEVGRGLQQDVLLAQLELSKLADLAIQIEGQFETAQARLNVLLDWPAARRSTLPERVSSTLPKLRPDHELQALAVLSRPVIAGMEKDIKAAESAVELAQKDYFPDLDFNAGYGFRSGESAVGSSRPDFASFGFSVSVPIFLAQKQARALDQKRSEMLERSYALADEKARVRGAVATAVADYERARNSASLFRTGIIPQARQTVASMLAAYQVNKVDFLNLVQAEITLYNYEMQFWLAIANANSALAELEAAVGTENIGNE